jgi:hypothetical protein
MLVGVVEQLMVEVWFLVVLVVVEKVVDNLAHQHHILQIQEHKVQEVVVVEQEILLVCKVVQALLFCLGLNYINN